MKLVEATADDLDYLVERWYALGHDGVTRRTERTRVRRCRSVPEGGFRAHLDDEYVTDYLVVENAEAFGFVTLKRHSSGPGTSVW